ncbi:hypothetical protein L596_010266 [Steinernema carpocapsae]|uniref:VASt domain-containing protein n=1 Tax=Steinernema carpocapsae TaxID=34508 RepID=A0A4U5PJ50_STECR|nr:hypothetical protein L596_010266 [Steinernema carpocapsae]
MLVRRGDKEFNGNYSLYLLQETVTLSRVTLRTQLNLTLVHCVTDLMPTGATTEISRGIANLSNTIANDSIVQWSISKKIRDVFKTDKESSPKSSPNLSPDSNPDPEAPDTNDPNRRLGKRTRRHASISERSLTFRYDHGFTHLKFADLNVHRSKYQLRASFLKFLRRYGVRIRVPRQQRAPHARKPARKLSLRPSAEWIGPMPAPKPAPSLDSKDDAKFEIVSKLNMESRVYPKEMYPVAPARKRKIDLRWGQARPPVRIRVFPDDVESGGPGWEQKIRDILMVDPTDETVSGAVQDPLYNSTTLTACTSTGQNHLTPPRSLPLTSLLRRSVDSAYSDGFTPISPGEDHRPNMIFTNKKSGSTDSPKTPFSRSSGIKGSRASTSSSSMSSVDIEPVSPMDPNATTIVPPPRKKERAVKKQNFGDSIKNFIKPTIDQRSQQFHKIFKGLVSTQETFVASYSCALQREILAQGRIYLSNVNIAFIANILGWETKQVIRFTDVVSIKRAKTAKIFANSIEIVTKDQTKHFFASFANREKSFVLMYRLWQMIASDVPPNGIICSDYKLLPPVYEMGRDQLDVDVGGANALELDRTTSMLFEPPTPSEPPTPDVSSIPDTEFPNPSLEDQDTASEADENEETNCTCNHEGKLYLDNVYEIPCEQLKSIMFGSTPWFYLYAAYMKNHSVHNKIINNIGPPSTFRCTPWQTLTTKENGRNVTKTTCVVTYTMTVNFSMTMRQIDVHEELELVKMFPKGNQGFKVIKETKNSGAPYTDCFVVNTSYCVTRISKTQSRLKVHGAMKFVKAAPWGPIKAVLLHGKEHGRRLSRALPRLRLLPPRGHQKQYGSLLLHHSPNRA